MGWSGTARVTRRYPGRSVRVGDYVLPTEAIWTFEGDLGSPTVQARFAVKEGRPQCVELAVTAALDGRAVRTSDLQLLSVDALTVSVFATLAMRASTDPETGVTEMTPVTDEREIWQVVAATEDLVKAPRRGTTDAELEQVAKIYSENVTDRPVQAVQVALGYGSERTAARRVQQARAAGLLPETTPGRPQAFPPKTSSEGTFEPPLESPLESRGHPATADELRAEVARLRSHGRGDLAAFYEERLATLDVEDGE